MRHFLFRDTAADRRPRRRPAGAAVGAATALCFVTAVLVAATAPQNVKEEKTARAIEKAYGIRIAVVDPPAAHGSIKYTPLASTDAASSWSHLRVFNEEFQAYPPAFVKSTQLKIVAFVTSLTVDGQERAAVPDRDLQTLWLDPKVGGNNEAYQRHVIHHEYYHLIEQQLNGDVYYKDPKWAVLNAADFHYGTGGANMRGAGVGVLDHPAAGFVNKYSQSGLEEDKAEVFATFFASGERNAVAQFARRDPILRAKMEFIRAFVAYYSAPSKGGTEAEGRQLLLDVKHDKVDAVAAALTARATLTKYQDWMGWTGLHWAVSLRRTKCFGLLLDRKVDVMAADKDGWTPLHVAALMGRLDECQALLNAGADRTKKDKLGRTPLDLAELSTAEKAADVATLLGR